MKFSGKNRAELLFITLFILIVIAVTIFGAYVSRRSISSFDGAMNLQVPVNLVEQGAYATDYPAFKEFDRKIQTGPTLLLPVALSFLLFGKSFFVANLVNLAYMLGFILLAFVFVKKVTNKWLGLLVMVLLPLLPGFFSIGLNQYGELPALFYLLAAVLLLARGRSSTNRRYVLLVASGLLLGFAILTKTVLLIALPSFVVIALLDLLFFKNIKLRHYLVFFSFVAVPLVSFELVKLTQLGLEEYQALWSVEFSKISQNAGVSDELKTADATLFATFSEHFKKLVAIFKANTFFTASFIIVPLAVAVRQLYMAFKEKRMVSKAYSFLVVSGVALSYFGWWLLITPTAKTYHRRIFDGILLQELLLIAAVGILIVQAYRYKKTLRALSILLASAGIYVMSFQLLSQKTEFHRYLEYPARKETVLRIAETIKSFPQQATIYGTGWWQAPRLSFLSEKKFTSLNHHVPRVGPLEDSYFVVDSEAYNIGRGEIQKTLSWFEYELVDSGQGYFLYRLNSFKGVER